MSCVMDNNSYDPRTFRNMPLLMYKRAVRIKGTTSCLGGGQPLSFSDAFQRHSFALLPFLTFFTHQHWRELLENFPWLQRQHHP
jgi:hypothetical protein